ncbi:MAG TPA: LON peptidase substrate-binding domain-containing protein, partial [Vicinamibacterales bacterium]|nr:LON peptidase substrate-binding domain-containing protein [Vicinamibacterales bacterium]
MAEQTSPGPAPTLPTELPVLPLRRSVVLPMTAAPLAVSRPVSVEAVNRALAGDRLVLLLLQTNDVDEPGPADLHRVGTVAVIRQMAKTSNGLRVLVEGVARARAEFFNQVKDSPAFTALIRPLPERSERSIEIDARVRRLQELVERALSIATGLSPDLRVLVQTIDDPLRICYLLASVIDMKPEDKQRLLEEDSLTVKLDAVASALAREIDVLELKGRIASRAEQEISDAQRQYILRQQLKAIQQELGEGDTEVQELRKRVAEAGLPEAVAAVANREIDRLERMTPASPEYQMIRTYLDWVLEIPWAKTTEDRLDPAEARRVLDEDHYDLDKIKERIVEYLAVQKLKASLAASQGGGDARRDGATASGAAPASGGTAPAVTMKGPILCFVGPPGVGKTSLGQSIARAMNRK